MRKSFMLILACSVLCIAACSEESAGPEPEPEPQVTRCVIPDYDYLKRQFFYFETPGDSFQDPAPGFGTIYPVIGGPEGDMVEVFVSLRPEEFGQTGVAEHPVRAYPIPDNTEIDESEHAFLGRFKVLEFGEDFELIQSLYQIDIRYFGLRLLESLDDDRALAVRYKSEDIISGATYVVGDYRHYPYQGEDTLLAELICPPCEDFGPDSTVSYYPSTWKMMMRNIYSLDTCVCIPGYGCDMRIEDASVGAGPHIHTASGLTYIRLFGLDRYNRTGNRRKDDLVDNIPEILDRANGLLMFPSPESFDTPYEVMLGLYYINPDVYYEESLFDYETLQKNRMIYNEILNPSATEQYHLYSIIIEITQ